MGRTIAGIAAVLALAVVAFSAAYFGGGALSKPPAAQATSTTALRAPGIALAGAPVAMRTPTATPTAAPKPKKRHTQKTTRHRKKTVVKRTYTAPRPTLVPVYKTPGIISED